jgi:dTDP-4-dehydrorhamnose reductase
MKILILGSQGQLGRCLYDQFSRTDYDLIYHSRSETDIADFTETSENLIALNPDLVVNATAYTAVDLAETHESLAYQVNHLAIDNLASQCAKIGSFLIHVSTDYVFDGTASRAYNEQDKTNPQSVYGASKLAGEIAIQRTDCRFLIIRTSWVFSEYGNNFFKTMLRLGAERETLSIVGDQIGCPTYAQDIASLIVDLIPRIDKGSVESGIYHFCGDTACSWYQFAKEIFAQADQLGYRTPKQVQSIATKDYPTPAKRPGYSVFDCTKIENTFNISRSNWRIGIDRVLSML